MGERAPFNGLCLCCQHGNELLGKYVHEALERVPLLQVTSRISHPEALAKKVRSIGAGELMNHYCVDRNLAQKRDIFRAENVAAMEDEDWLANEGALGNSEIQVLGIHNNFQKGLDFCGVGNIASRKTLLVCYQLGHRKCIVYSDSFFDAVPNGAISDKSFFPYSYENIPEDVYENAAKNLYEQLQQISEEGIDLSDYVKVKNEMEFYRYTPIPSTQDGRIASYLPGLETIPVPDSAFDPIFSFDQIPQHIRQLLDIPDAIYMETWGHENMSKRLSKRGDEKGRRRRQYFGAYLVKINPPRLLRTNKEWVIFDDSKLRTSSVNIGTLR